MNDKYYCVIDADGFYKDLVLALITQRMDGELVEQIQGYKLAEGESLVLRTDACRQPTIKSYVGASGFVRPKWDGTAWVEGATAEEIAAWEAEHPAPELPAPIPDLTGRIAALEAEKAEKTELEAIASAIERGLSL